MSDLSKILDRIAERTLERKTPELKYDAKEVRKILRRQRDQRGVKVSQSKLP